MESNRTITYLTLLLHNPDLPYLHTTYQSILMTPTYPDPDLLYLIYSEFEFACCSMCDKARYQSSEEESMAAAVDAANDDTFVLQDHLLQQQLQLQQQQQQQQRHHSQNSDFHSPAYDTNRNNYPGGGDVLDMGDPPFSLYNIYF